MRPQSLTFSLMSAGPRAVAYNPEPAAISRCAAGPRPRESEIPSLSPPGRIERYGTKLLDAIRTAAEHAILFRTPLNRSIVCHLTPPDSQRSVAEVGSNSIANLGVEAQRDRRGVPPLRVGGCPWGCVGPLTLCTWNLTHSPEGDPVPHFECRLPGVLWGSSQNRIQPTTDAENTRPLIPISEAGTP